MALRDDVRRLRQRISEQPVPLDDLQAAFDALNDGEPPPPHCHPKAVEYAERIVGFLRWEAANVRLEGEDDAPVAGDVR